jgi:hypothetical protein
MKVRTTAPRRSRGWAVGAVGVLIVGHVLGANGAVADVIEVDAESASHGHGIYVDGLGLDVVGAAYTQSA